MRYCTEISIGVRKIGVGEPTYFIADVASNHNGDIEKAKELIYCAKEAGADAVKFQHFLANRIVSDYGFKSLGRQGGHQAKWKKSVYEVYKECEVNRLWNDELIKTAKDADIEFMTTPYDTAAVDLLDDSLPAYKIGSGDITWTDFLRYVAAKNKPVLLATGASDIRDVERAIDCIVEINPRVVLMQCNTNYTGSLENFKFVNLKVLKTYDCMYPGIITGLSDHTPGHASVLGAVCFGAKVIEKHFTLDNSMEGPDHAFSMNPVTWRDMIDRTRELECALGNGIKRVEFNERETVVLQRRCLRYSRDMKAGERINKEDLEALRPAPEGALLPFDESVAIGKTMVCDVPRGEAVRKEQLR